MMRKLADIIIILIIIAMVSIIVPNSQAVTEANDGGETTANIEMNLTPTVQVSEDAKTVVLTLSLGSFQGVAENTQLAYQGTLAYDANIFEKVEVVGLNGWIIGYSDETKIIQGDTGSAKSNNDISDDFGITALIFLLARIPRILLYSSRHLGIDISPPYSRNVYSFHDFDSSSRYSAKDIETSLLIVISSAEYI